MEPSCILAHLPSPGPDKIIPEPVSCAVPHLWEQKSFTNLDAIKKQTLEQYPQPPTGYWVYCNSGITEVFSSCSSWARGIAPLTFLGIRHHPHPPTPHFLKAVFLFLRPELVFSHQNPSLIRKGLLDPNSPSSSAENVLITEISGICLSLFPNDSSSLLIVTKTYLS